MNCKPSRIYGKPNGAKFKKQNCLHIQQIFYDFLMIRRRAASGCSLTQRATNRPYFNFSDRIAYCIINGSGVRFLSSIVK